MNNAGLPSTVALQKLAPIASYIEIRDELWLELNRRIDVDTLSQRSSTACAPLAYQLGLLELANRVVSCLLNAQHETTIRAINLLRCEACDIFIGRAKYELRAARRGQAPPTLMSHVP